MRLCKTNENRRHCFRPPSSPSDLNKEPHMQHHQVRFLSITGLQAGPTLLLSITKSDCVILPTSGLQLWYVKSCKPLGHGRSLLPASLSSSGSLYPHVSANNDHFLKKSISLERSDSPTFQVTNSLRKQLFAVLETFSHRQFVFSSLSPPCCWASSPVHFDVYIIGQACAKSFTTIIEFTFIL